jgi:hypothetical protein
MSLPNRYPEDDLDHLVRGALEAQVSGKEPPDRVWKQIKAELQTDGSPPPRRYRASWSPLVIQAALTLLLVMIGGIALLGPSSLRDSFYDMSPSGTVAYVADGSIPPGVTMFDDEAELRSLKADFGSRPAVQPDTEPVSPPPVVIPRDVPRNVLFSEGRVTESEPSLSLTVKGQNPTRSGPYPWYR